MPDLERCRRIRWPKAFIENAERCPKSPGCGGVIAWKAEHRARKNRNGTQIRERIKFYLEEESYIVVFEPREHYCLLITAYYVDNDHSRKMIEREMARNHAEKAGGAVWAPPEDSFTHTVDELSRLSPHRSEM